MSTPDNTALFRTGPKRIPEASRSWWMDADTREAFREAAEREQARLRRSIGAAMVNSNGVIVGHLKNK